MPDDRALTEVEVAHRLGFGRFRDFQTARKKGLVPEPDLHLQDGDRWSETHFEAWLSGDAERWRLQAEQDRLVERLERGENAPPPRARTDRR